MKITTWNIAAKAALGWNGDYSISENVASKICNSDIVVLTEFVATFGLDGLLNKLKENGFLWFYVSEAAENGIFIAVRKETREYSLDLAKLQRNVYKDRAATIHSVSDGANILKVNIPLKSDEDITVIGFRMKTGGDIALQYEESRYVFDSKLLPLISEGPNNSCIVAGDFNNARCLASLNKAFDERDYLGFAQKKYNLNYIKDALTERGFTMTDNDDGKPIPTCGIFPLDHIFVRGYEVNEIAKTEIAGALSDHEMISANISFLHAIR